MPWMLKRDGQSADEDHLSITVTTPRILVGDPGAAGTGRRARRPTDGAALIRAVAAARGPPAIQTGPGALDGIGPAYHADTSQLDLINVAMDGIRVLP